jgi:imidazolonepropionase-like amidohydrolase
VLADGVANVQCAAREQLRLGAHQIKIMGSGGIASPTDPLAQSQYSEAEIRAVVEEADRHGTYVMAHCHPDAAARRCIEFGVRSIEHGTLIQRETAQLAVEKGAFVVPTVAVIDLLARYGKELGLLPASQAKAQEMRKNPLETLSILHQAGVKVGFGTDLIGAFHVQQTLELTLRAEVSSNFDVLCSATSVNAELLNSAGQLGCVTNGAQADLLVIDGNPLQDLNLITEGGRYMPVIMKSGKFHRYEL